MEARHKGERHVVLPICTGVPQGGFPQPALDSVAKFVQRHPRIDILLRLLETTLVDWQGQVQLHQYAWSLEMCTRSWADESCVRVHIRAFLRHEYRLRVRRQFQLKFMGSLPVKSMRVGERGTRTDVRTRACTTRSTLSEDLCFLWECSAIQGLLGFWRMGDELVAAEEACVWRRPC